MQVCHNRRHFRFGDGAKCNLERATSKGTFSFILTYFEKITAKISQQTHVFTFLRISSIVISSFLRISVSNQQQHPPLWTMQPKWKLHLF
jgi:hypothetical protein